MQSSLLIKYLELNRLSLTLWRMDMTSLNFQWRDLPGHSKIHGFPELPLEKILQDKYTQLPWWTLNNSTKAMQYARAVWEENGKEMEGTIPEVWINMDEGTVRWPKKKEKYCYDNHVPPMKDWDTFRLIKKKFTSESVSECDEYNFTSQAEDKEEEEEMVSRKRKKTTKKLDDFIEGSDLSDEDILGAESEERMGDVNLEIPPFPMPPKPMRTSENGSPRSHGQGELTNCSSRSVDQDKSTSRTPRSHGQGGSTNQSLRSVDRDRSTSRTPRSHGQGGSTNRSSRSVDRDRSTSRSSRSVDRDRSTSRSSRSVDQDKSTSRTPRSHGQGGSTNRRPRSQGRGRSINRSSRSVDRDRSTSRSLRSVDRDRSTSRTPRSHGQGGSTNHPPKKRSFHTTEKFPIPEAKFQKIVVTNFVKLHEEIKKLQRSSEPYSASLVERIKSLEEFKEKESSLQNQGHFDTLVCQLSRVGGKDLKDCTHKVLDRLFTNEVMALLNMKGKGKKDKMGIEDTNLFSAIKAAVMKWDQSATEAAIRAAAGDHLKHAPGRVGGGGLVVPEGGKDGWEGRNE
ncbi:uncharacterized protein LOC125902480 isoform X10 [Epinephelus fuscoguttatus]|uniref:uncharacterized protein LOC125902480 isoform X8 n=1 Tax=Epinephelus fuscoguttatus TaxID=293821 RepID=UPI0020D06754|nr:uncharacterized protein LOC125902480 isoform X8 [Epinephelus fuscoguttatus]XP_049454793.1 uncharacterized protein LOC125902480 isoform X9 [Epinephelus fuscoguttatus]XP_049454794.1 uncharacterized protein LOC125902480 isoform X10 [Epinephelus fuscoguttatus]